MKHGQPTVPETKRSMMKNGQKARAIAIAKAKTDEAVRLALWTMIAAGATASMLGLLLAR